jgi:cobalt/nickel transport protein
MKRLTIITIAVLAAVIAIPVVGLTLKSGAAFSGSDDGGTNAIAQIDPNYKPWFHDIWQQSETTNQVMFGFQGLLGAGILFSALGYFAGRTRGRSEAQTGKERPLGAGLKATYAALAAVALSVVPVIYYGAGYRPPSGEIICLFLALEGAMLSGFACFALFFLRGRRKGLTEPQGTSSESRLPADAS